MPKTQALHDFLSEKMMGFRYDAEAIWIGAHDMKEEETYVWEDGSEMEFQDNMNRWNGGWFGGDEDCIALKKGDREWHDYPCGHKLPFICQYPIQVQEQDDVSSHGEDGQDGQDGQDEGNTEDQDGQDEAVSKDQDGEGGPVEKDQDGEDEEVSKDEDDEGEPVEKVQDDAGKTDDSGDVKVEDDKCGPFDCQELDCGMRGFVENEDGCPICECNEPTEA